MAWLTTNKPEAAKEFTATAADVSSVEAIIQAVYDVISGPAGDRDWNRFHSLFRPDAKMGASVQRVNGTTVFRTFSPADYQKNNAPHFQQRGFYEEELGREVKQFGNLAHVQSAYQYRLAPGAKVEKRGVNYFTLVKADGRWWITQLIWQEENKDNPIPADLLK